ncbi:MAG: helix-turn-helix transcriptional regulator [Thermoplasmata archaeon]|nr:helix-turn-helix transcriptional regulator [Thermoplasmata archaeon]
MGALSDRRHRVRIRLNFETYPVQPSLGVLGRRWAFLVLMKIALAQADRFNELLRTTPGMSKRILAMRLRELEADGFLRRVEVQNNFTRWGLTQKGADVLPILLTLIHFGSKWSSDRSRAGETGSFPSNFDVTYLPTSRAKASGATSKGTKGRWRARRGTARK